MTKVVEEVEQENLQDEQQAIVIAPKEGSMLDVASKLDGLEEAKGTGLNLVKEYLEMDVSEMKRFVLFGFGEMINKEDGEITVTAELMDSGKQLYLTASFIIVNAVKNCPLGTGVAITYKGEEKLKGGKKLKKFNVELLDL